MKNYIFFFFCIIGFSSLFAIGCQEKANHAKHSMNHGVLEKVEALEQQNKKMVMKKKAQPDDPSLVTVSDKNKQFYIHARKPMIKSFSCTECHSKPLANMERERKDGKEAHWEIEIEHASSATMNCTTCHSATNMDDLVSVTGKAIDFNMSHKLCAQCHDVEYNDWLGGGHGKRVSGWDKARVAKTCVSCHNPHKPDFDKRWPARYNMQSATADKK